MHRRRILYLWALALTLLPSAPRAQEPDTANESAAVELPADAPLDLSTPELDPGKLAEHELSETQRGRIVPRVDVGKRDKLSVGRKGIRDRIHHSILRGRQHVAPREAADDALGLA